MLNEWLQKNDGFNTGNAIDIHAMGKFGFHDLGETHDVTMIKRQFKRGSNLIINVKNTWVVLNSYSVSHFLVNDPLNDTNKYE